MKRIFLTGASAGIGRAITRELTAAGHEVWGTSRDLGRLPDIPQFHPVQLDLRDFQSLESIFDRAWNEANGFDVVINNAGSGHFGPAESLSSETIADQFQILFHSQVKLLQLTLGAMRRRNGGTIINVSSLAARLPVPFMAAYNAAKAAMASFIMTMQLESGDENISIVDLQPADIRTDFNDAVVKSAAGDFRYDEALAKTWKAVERNMREAPPADLVAEQILKLIDGVDLPPRVTVGGVFQAKVAPVIFRFLPQRVRIWGLKNYYRI